MKKYFTLAQWIEKLKASGKLLNLTTLKRLSGIEEEASIRKSVSRLVKKGIIKKVGKGLYLNTFNPSSTEELAMVLKKPCYISFESALSYYGIITQIPFVLTCATTGKPYKSERIVFHHISPKLFWGYIGEHSIFYAEKEKALLDWIYWFRKTQSVDLHLDEFDFSLLDIKKLKKYSKKFPETVRNVLKDIL